MNLRKAPLKFVSATVLSLITGLMSESASANHLDFTLYNESDKPIYSLYISSARSPNWGSNVLGRDFLDVREFTQITFPGQSNRSPCMYDIKARLSDGSTRQGRFNLCQTRSVTVR
ncbi:MAG: hypothetical protein DCF19_07370 [Pseudanabaena frigida]|uniref:Uncharacterized protein n=1 Tax=Pseudanabaena frigida TaxID=945775 RepID=A0A2W4WCZ7_9CYAN|nr:MAG: hypothetical protein DCF19_07370 [Pseudanabaena frigida]